MGIGKRIREARLNKKLTQEELAKIIGVTKGAIANYEGETSHPKEPVMYALIDALGVDANFLFQDCVDTIKKSPAPAKADTGEITLEESNALLVALGYIKPGEQISDEDLAFLGHIIGLLDSWFDKSH